MKTIEVNTIFISSLDILAKYFDTDKANVIKLSPPIGVAEMYFDFLFETLAENKLVTVHQHVVRGGYNLSIKDFDNNYNNCKIEILDISSEATKLLKKANYYFEKANEKIQNEK